MTLTDNQRSLMNTIIMNKILHGDTPHDPYPGMISACTSFTAKNINLETEEDGKVLEYICNENI